MRTGVIYDEPSSVYHATDGVSSHRLQDFSYPNCELLYYRKYIAKKFEEPRESEALAFGEYFHALAVEGETVADSRFTLMPKFDRRTKSGKAEAEDWAIKNAGKMPIASEDRDLAWLMVDSLRAKPVAKAIFDHGKPEVVFRHKLASFPIQSRVDWFDERLDDFGRPLIADIKTIDHLSNFDRQFHKFAYWKQAGFYQMVVYETLGLIGDWPRLLFVVCEKNEPFQVEVREPDPITLDIARTAIMRDLERLKRCYDTGIWRGSSDEITPVSIPEYIKMRLEQ